MTLEALHNLIVGYLKHLLNGLHIPYHSVQCTVWVYTSYG